MNLPKQLVLIRHAESERNKATGGKRFWSSARIWEGGNEVPDHLVQLTDWGREQSRRAGLALARRYGVFDVVYDSGYQRTIETCEAMLDAYTGEERSNLCLCRDTLLRERDEGYLYNMTEEEGMEAFPWFHEYWKKFGPFFTRPPGGESIADVCKRAHIFLARINTIHARKRVMVVTHNRMLYALRSILEGWTHEEVVQRMYNEKQLSCSITVCEPDLTKSRLISKISNEILY